MTNATLVQVPFDLEHWTKVAAEQYPNGLPEPHSDDPTQWLFKGHPKGSEDPLQVAVARLLGYRWPDQEADELERFVDPDGIVCLPAVLGETPAAERLREVLATAWGSEWSAGVLDQLLSEAGATGKGLDLWLRDEFFAAHCRRFHNRPFIWHIWDGKTRRLLRPRQLPPPRPSTAIEADAQLPDWWIAGQRLPATPARRVPTAAWSPPSSSSTSSSYPGRRP